LAEATEITGDSVSLDGLMLLYSEATMDQGRLDPAASLSLVAGSYTSIFEIMESFR
jgi:hypothetical protein